VEKLGIEPKTSSKLLCYNWGRDDAKEALYH